MSNPDKIREDRLRRAARRQGYQLVKNPRRDPRATDYGSYMLVNPDTNAVVADFGWDHASFPDGNTHLDDVEAYLTRERKTVKTGRTAMSTGYEHMTDRQFWAEVAGLLNLMIRHHGGSPADHIGGLADYVHAEAERRDPELAASSRRRAELVKTADARQPFDPFSLAVDQIPFTADEKAEWQQLIITYNQRFAALATETGEQR